MYIYIYIYHGLHNWCQKKTTTKYNRDNKTNKFGRALTTYGYDNFQFEMLETVQLSERQELYDIEDTYMIRFDSINKGYNTRINYES